MYLFIEFIVYAEEKKKNKKNKSLQKKTVKKVIWTRTSCTLDEVS